MLNYCTSVAPKSIKGYKELSGLKLRSDLDFCTIPCTNIRDISNGKSHSVILSTEGKKKKNRIPITVRLKDLKLMREAVRSRMQVSVLPWKQIYADQPDPCESPLELLDGLGVVEYFGG